MPDPDHNKPEKAELASVATLADLREFIAKCDLPAEQRNLLRSAIKRADALVGHGALDLPADIRPLLERLDGWSPAMAGMTAGSFANLKSRLRAAFRLAEARIAKPGRLPDLEGEWKELYAQLTLGQQRRLSRLFRFAHARGWQPCDMSDGHIERFKLYLRDEAVVVQWYPDVRESIRFWNRVVVNLAHVGLPVLTQLPSKKREPYWISTAEWPDSLRDDLQAFLSNLTDPDCFSGKRVRKRKPATARCYRNLVITVVSASVRNGVPLSDLQRLSDAIAPDNLNQALMFLHKRQRGQVTPQMIQLAMRAQVIAEWCDLPADDRQRIAAMFANAKEHSNWRKGMTPKNRALLDRLDDQRFSDLVHMLPQLLLDRAQACGNRLCAATTVRTAVAIELLLVCSLRRENLITLRLDKSIRKIGHPPNDQWVVEIEAEEVKNDEPLRFSLPETSRKLLETYLTDWRPRLCAQPSPWLFPGQDGGPIKALTMLYGIQAESKRILGVGISTHQFRHISAECYLLENPDALYTISQHLGHRDPNTTKTYYARPKQREASRRYQEQVLRSRTEAELRIGRGRRRRPGVEKDRP